MKKVFVYHFREVKHKCVIMTAESLEECVEYMKQIGFDDQTDDESGFLKSLPNLDVDQESPDNEQQWETLPYELYEVVQAKCKHCMSYDVCSDVSYTRYNPIECNRYKMRPILETSGYSRPCV